MFSNNLREQTKCKFYRLFFLKTSLAEIKVADSNKKQLSYDSHDYFSMRNVGKSPPHVRALMPRLFGKMLFPERGPPSQPSQLQRVFQKENVNPFARAKNWLSARACSLLSRLDPVDQAGEAKVRVGPARRVTLPSRRTGDPASSRANFLFHVNGSPDFVRKCMKSWLAQGNPGTLHFFFYKNIFYKNIEAEICKILSMF